LATLFRLAFCFLAKKKKINKQLKTQTLEPIFTFITSQPKNKKHPLKSFDKRIHLCNFVDLWANLAFVESSSPHSVTNSLLSYKIQGQIKIILVGF
jgi:hypothetical protein